MVGEVTGTTGAGAGTTGGGAGTLEADAGTTGADEGTTGTGAGTTGAGVGTGVAVETGAGIEAGASVGTVDEIGAGAELLAGAGVDKPPVPKISEHVVPAAMAIGTDHWPLPQIWNEVSLMQLNAPSLEQLPVFCGIGTGRANTAEARKTEITTGTCSAVRRDFISWSDRPITYGIV